MSRRRRWTPVRGTGSRVYELWERLALGTLDLPGRVVCGALRAVGATRPPAIDRSQIRDVLVLRLDRIGDVLMSLQALDDLRAALPRARVRLAVGAWSEPVARRAPVDEVLVWNAPWVGRPSEGTESLSALIAKARSLARGRIDLAFDLQGDVRASLLLWLSAARIRVGYANTGGGYLLTHVVPLDETVSWVEQNRLAVAAILGAPDGTGRTALLGEEDRAFARRLLADVGLERRRPLVAIHPSGGRLVKQWDPERWGEVAARLESEHGAAIVVTGSEADRPLVAAIGRRLAGRAVDLTGRLRLRETLAVIGALDLFLSPDTGPMHIACAVGTPSVSVFGPSDPGRYFSGREPRHVVVRSDLWCSPCNLIRKPPAECRVGMPECLRLVGVDAVCAAAARLLSGPSKDPAEARS
jgi:ADP-heptose:LPS heptosyltransferase